MGAPEPLAGGVSGVLGTLGAGPSVMGAAMEQGAVGLGASEGVARGVGDVAEAIAPTPLKGDVFGAITRGRVGASLAGGAAGAAIGAAVSPEEERGLGAVRGGAMGFQLGAVPVDLAQGAGRMLGRLQQTPGAQEAQRLGIVPPNVARAAGEANVAGVRGDENFMASLRRTPGAKLTNEGIEIDLTRYQQEGQEGVPTSRQGIFYTPTATGYGETYRQPAGRTAFGGPVGVLAPRSSADLWWWRQNPEGRSRTTPSPR